MTDLVSPFTDPLEAFRASLAQRPDAACLIADGRTQTFAEVDAASDATATALVERGVDGGARVALHLQNDPQFVSSVLGAWKVGAIPVPVNPMWRTDELGHLFATVTPTVLVARRDLLGASAPAIDRSGIAHVLVTSGQLAGDDGDDDGAADAIALATPTSDLDEVLAGGATGAPRGIAPRPAEAAYLVATSGTTGRPKAAITTPANLLHSTEVYHRGLALSPDDVILGAAPLFHITGLVAGIALGHRSGCPLVLLHRFTPASCLAAIERWRTTTTVMAITAYIALMDDPDLAATDPSSLAKAYSGGAPVAPAVARRWEDATGGSIRNVYGLTETTSPTHMVPLDRPGRVHPDLGVLSVGVPVPGARARVVDADSREEVPAGGAGEIEVRGPMVVPGYWRSDVAVARPDDGWFATGDVGLADEDGWFYVIDRSKDMINASGFKVWPGEVEDVLRAHDAVRDAAVVGVPDSYRGETVCAFVTLRRGAVAVPEELVAHCRERLAAYKYPRRVEVLDELPTSAAGKVLRRVLRDQVTAEQGPAVT
jgi:long-chain acyl-CoA synthetase